MAIKISYPITESAKQAINRYPNIKKAFKLPLFGRSEYEIVRLLNNTHYDGIVWCLGLIDKMLPDIGAMGNRLLRTKHPFEFYQVLAEVILFKHLQAQFHADVTPCESNGSPRTADIEVKQDGWIARVELYTPVELMGYQLFERYVPSVLKYLDVKIGYVLSVETIAIGGDRDQNFYPYTFPGESEVYKWLDGFASSAYIWLSGSNPAPDLRMTAPGGGVELIVKLNKINEHEEERLIIFNEDTKSNDTRLNFQIGSAEATAKSKWGKKLRRKIFDQQCGLASEDKLRILAVNFRMADTFDISFITCEPFLSRFRETIRLLVAEEKPYDLVLPVSLNEKNHFGQPVWISESWKEKGQAFVESFIS